LENAQSQVRWLFANPTIASSNCALCIASLQIAKFLSLAAPEQTPLFFVFLCQQFKLSSNCNSTYSATTLGPVLTQVVANANISGYDGQVRAVTLEPLHLMFDSCCPYSLVLADLPELRLEILSASTYAPSEPHRLVFQAKT
jgi:hypothetical protein